MKYKMRIGGKVHKGDLSRVNTREEISYLFIKFMHAPEARSFEIYESLWERISRFIWKKPAFPDFKEEPVRNVESPEPRIRLVVDNTR
jgi:hypothetical protein